MTEAEAVRPDDPPYGAISTARTTLRTFARQTAWLLVALGIGLAVAGQAATSRNLDSHLHLLAGAVRRMHVLVVYGAHPRTVVFSGILLLLGGVLFAIGTRGDARDGDTVFDGTAPAVHWTGWRAPATVIAALLLAAGALVSAYVNIKLLRGDYAPSLVWWFLLSIALVDRAIRMSPWSPARPLSFWPRPWEWAVVGAAVAYFVIVNLHDLNSWRYAAIGDEYAFFSFAKAMQNQTLQPNVFSQFGVYIQRPVGTSGLQAASMAVFGADSYGWRMATPIALAATIPALYILARELFDRAVAVYATLMFAVSHYLLSYSHTVYDNVFAILPFTWSLALAVIGLRRSSPAWLYAAGVVAGLGFYTFPTARMAPIVLFLFLVTLGRRAWHPAILLPIGLGLLVTVLPLFASDGLDAISASRDRTVFGFTPDHEAVGIRILQNLPRSSLVWSYNPNAGHFVSGSLFDPVSAVLLALGLGYGLARIRQQAYRLLAIWLGVTVLFAGVFSPYDRAPYDRLHLLLPVVSIYAALALDALVRLGSRVVPGRRGMVMYAGVAAFIVLAPVLAYLNLYRFFIDSPKVVPSTEERIALGGLESSACRGAASTLIIIREPRPLLDPALDTYGFDRSIQTRSVADAAAARDFADFGCVVVTRPKDHAQEVPAGSAADVARRLQTDYGFTEAGAVSSPVLPIEAAVFTRG
jgi:4-amino-4-deoxy-L-arabinose transferase-like glycosyltransferase